MGNQLANRVAGKAAAKQNNGGGEKTLAHLINDMVPEIRRALPKHMDADRVARIATTVARQTPQLLNCNPQSFLGALMTASQLGLEPGPLGEAYLVPFWDNKNKTQNVQFIPGYRGLIKLAWQSGQVSRIAAHVVHENDDFDFAYGETPKLEHRPALSNPGKPIAVYASATMVNGGSTFVVMSVEEVESIRARSKAAKSGPWVTDWEAMANKTLIKQLIRYLPLSTEIANAAAMDGTSRTDTGDLDAAVPNYADGNVIEAEEDPQAEEPMPAYDADGVVAEDAQVEEPPSEPDWPDVPAPGSKGGQA